MIVSTESAISIADNPEFREFMLALNPTAPTPSRHTITTHLVDYVVNVEEKVIIINDVY